MTFSELAERIGTIESDTRKFAYNILNTAKYRDVIKGYVQENLMQGKRPDGSMIEKTPQGKQKQTRYERYTVYLKSKRGLETDIVDLRDTGSFYEGIDVKFGYSEILIRDLDAKTSILEAVWGQVLGLSEEQMFEFAELIKPEIESYIANRLRT